MVFVKVILSPQHSYYNINKIKSQADFVKVKLNKKIIKKLKKTIDIL